MSMLFTEVSYFLSCRDEKRASKLGQARGQRCNGNLEMRFRRRSESMMKTTTTKWGMGPPKRTCALLEVNLRQAETMSIVN
jgi:hypothetical protein